MVIKLEGSLGDFMNDQDVIAGQDANVIKGNENSITSNSNNTTNNISIYTNPTINKGLSTSDVMSICDFMVNKALAEFNSANEKAITRNEDFAQVFIPRLEKIENYISHISDPKFQFLCRDAMTSAAQTERKEDYQLLSELLACHVEKGITNKKIDSAVSRAIKIVDEVDNAALCGLTLALAIRHVIPVTGNIREGIGVLNTMYEKLLHCELPKDDWLDHLETLGAIRFLNIKMERTIEWFLSTALNGYVCIGIKKNSEKHKQIQEKLKKVNLSEDLLVDHECLEGYIRLPIRNNEAVKNFTTTNSDGKRMEITDQQIVVLEEILASYEKDDLLMREVKKNMITIWDSFPTLKAVREWWDDVSGHFSITYIGKVLAHTNAKRCDSTFPDLLT